MSTEAALVFDTPQVQEELDQLALEGTFLGAELAMAEPHDVDYVITDADHMHIARRYRMIPTEVRLTVVLMHVQEEQQGTVRQTDWRRRVRQFRRSWEQFVDRNQIREPEEVDLEAFIQDFRAEIEAAEQRTREAVQREHAFSDSIRNHMQNQRRFSGLTTRGMERAAQQRAQERQANQARYGIDWEASDTWTCPGPDGNPVRWPIAQMQDKHLWDTICWLVRNSITLFRQYVHHCNPDVTESLASKQWLRAQPTFRALVQAGVRRRLTFPRDVYQYLRDYVLHSKEDVQAAVPWADPEESYQADQLASFLDEPIDVPRPIDAQREFGKELRDIDLD